MTDLPAGQESEEGGIQPPSLLTHMTEIWNQKIAVDIWYDKYRNNDEKTMEDSLRRVAYAIMEDEPEELRKKTLRYMLERAWNPGGRIHAGAGTSKHVTLQNCYTLQRIEDSMVSIMETLNHAAITQQAGGGIGMEFSTLRPRGALVKGHNTESSGPVSFMHMWDSMCATIMSAGSRRGAQWAGMADWHPDVIEFIHAKQTKGVLTNFNISVMISEPFMDAVKNDLDWDLVFNRSRFDGIHVDSYKTPIDHPLRDTRGGNTLYVYKRMKARELWDMIIQSTYEYAEPGIVFIDRINQVNNLGYCENIRATNPCGEEPLPPNGNCNLGAVNLAVMVRSPFTPHARIAWERLSDVVRVGMRFLDNVLDKSRYPLDIQDKESKAKRRTGLGVTGLANMFMMLGIRYGSEESLKVTDDVMSFIAKEAYLESSRIAKEKGSFTLFNEKKFLESPMVKRLDERFNGEISEAIKENGIRNGVLMTIAPTGTTSIYYGYTSAGLEPVFQLDELKRKVLRQDGGHDIKPAGDFGMLLYNRLTNGEKQDWMVSAMELSVEEHLSVQEVCQRWIDASISKTINCPKDMSYEDFQEVYMSAYDRGLKGCTTYRPSGVRGSVYVEKDAGEEAEKGTVPAPVQEAPKTASRHVVEVRPRTLTGTTYKIRWPNIAEAFYVTINDVVDAEGERHPYELFINTKSTSQIELYTALTRTISAILRQGRDAVFLIDELIGIQSEKGGIWRDGEYIPSLISEIGHVIRNHFEGLGILEPMPEKTKVVETVKENEAQSVIASSDIASTLSLAEECPSCGKRTYIPSSGCMLCSSCGFSTCG